MLQPGWTHARPSVCLLLLERHVGLCLQITGSPSLGLITSGSWGEPSSVAGAAVSQYECVSFERSFTGKLGAPYDVITLPSPFTS